MKQLTTKFVIGRLGKPRGLKGELKVIPLTEDTKRFKKLKKCFLEDEKGNIQQELDVAFARVANTNVSIQFDNVQTREDADSLKGLYISVPREEAIKLAEDEFFVADLVGCSVYDEEHGLLGEIAQIQSNISADFVIVKKKGERDLLYPNMKTIVKNISISERRVDVCLPDGLYEIYRG